MKKKNILLLEKPGSILLKDKNAKQKMVSVVEKLGITLYGLVKAWFHFIK